MTLTKNECGYYEVRFKGPDGKFRRRSTGRSDKDEALEFVRDAKLREIETAAEMGVLSQEVVAILTTGAGPISVDDAIEPWKEHMAYRRLSPRTIGDQVLWVRAWAAWARIGKKPVAQLKIQDFDGWLNNPDGRSKVGTRRVMLSALKSFCRFCQDSGWMNGNPANLLQVDMSILLHSQLETLKRPCFTDEEVQALIDGTALDGICPDPFWHAAIIVGRHTGLRLGDICGLEWDCLDFPNWKMTVWTQKRDRRVELPLLPPLLHETLLAVPRVHPDYLFPHQRGISISPQYRAHLSNQFTAIMREIGIPPGKTFHCLRATYCTDCDLRGVPIEHISRSVGHANRDATLGYIRKDIRND